MIRNPVELAIVVVMAVLVVISGPASAQNIVEDPRWVAARWMLDRLKDVDPDSSVTVDTLSFGRGLQTARPLSAEDVRSNRSLARHLGSRTGALGDLMSCPNHPPDPQPRGRRRGCRLADGVRMVLQVDAAEPKETGVLVKVASWNFRENLEGGYSVDLYSQELRLEQNHAGAWEVVRLGLAIRGHW